MVKPLTYEHGSDIYVLCAHNDMVAIGGIHSVDVLLPSDNACKIIASFHLGTPITAICWRDSTSPNNDDHWSIELAVATSDYAISILSHSHDDSQNIFTFGGGLSGHHGRVHDLSFCGGRGIENRRYLATVSDDKMLMIWDLQPELDSQPHDSPSPGMDIDYRPQPTAYPIPFEHPLLSVCAHPSTSKELLVSDSRGSIYLTDWRTDFTDRTSEAWHHPNVLELVEPRAMADTVMGFSGPSTGSLAWSKENADIIGAVYGARFSLWDLSKLSGGKPNVTGSTFSHGGNRFRWCQNHPDFFAISAQPSPMSGAVINVYNMNYAGTHPTTLDLGTKTHVRDFDFVASDHDPRIAAVLGQKVIFSDVN